MRRLFLIITCLLAGVASVDATPSMTGPSGLLAVPSAETLDAGNICLGVWGNCLMDSKIPGDVATTVPVSMTLGVGTFWELYGMFPNLLFNNEESYLNRGTLDLGSKMRIIGGRRTPFKLSADFLVQRHVSEDRNADGTTDISGKAIASYNGEKLGIHGFAGYLWPGTITGREQNQIIGGAGAEYQLIPRIRLMAEVTGGSSRYSDGDFSMEAMLGGQYHISPHLSFNLGVGGGFGSYDPQLRILVGFSSCQGIGTYVNPIPVLVRKISQRDKLKAELKPLKIIPISTLILKASAAQATPVSKLEVEVDQDKEEIIIKPYGQISIPPQQASNNLTSPFSQQQSTNNQSSVLRPQRSATNNLSSVIVQQQSTNNQSSAIFPSQASNNLSSAILRSQASNNLSSAILRSQSSNNLSSAILPSQSSNNLSAAIMPYQASNNLSTAIVPYQASNNLSTAIIPYQSSNNLTTAIIPFPSSNNISSPIVPMQSSSNNLASAIMPPATASNNLNVIVPVEIPLKYGDEDISIHLKEREEMEAKAFDYTMNRLKGVTPLFGMDIMGRQQSAPLQLPDKMTVYRKFRFPDVTFDFDQWSLTDEGKKMLSEVAEQIRKDKKWLYLKVDGHTDSVGSNTYNMDLSLKRAVGVATYLISSEGIDPSRIFVKGFGKSSNIADNTSSDGRKKNRRTEILLLVGKEMK